MTNEDAINTLKIMASGIELRGYNNAWLDAFKKFYDMAIKALEAQGWIPVTERLPEINVDVIVTDIETTETYSSYYLGDGFWECDNGTHNNRIIAWMPFPEPYTKEDSDHEKYNQ